MTGGTHVSSSTSVVLFHSQTLTSRASGSALLRHNPASSSRRRLRVAPATPLNPHREIHRGPKASGALAPAATDAATPHSRPR